MFIKERRLRLVGYFILTTIFFVFFMLEMFFSWKDEYMFPKVFFITIVHTLLIWEPTRFFILQLRKGNAGLAHVKRRLKYALLILVPYALFIGFFRIYLEDATNIWNVPIGNISTYSYTIGITLLFVLLELTVYESLYFFDHWSKSLAEAEELKRLNFQIQLDSLKVKIQPHFLFNTLNTLIGLIEADSGRAIKFTENLAYVYRYLLQANDRTLISLEEELRFTTIYFSLLKTRYPDGLYLMEIVDNVANFEVPPLSLHILIENAVKHNNFSRAKPLNIKLEFLEQERRVIVVNNIQPKGSSEKIGKGLVYLQKQFEILNLPEIKVQKKADSFSVSIPLINKYLYERINY